MQYRIILALATALIAFAVCFSIASAQTVVFQVCLDIDVDSACGPDDPPISAMIYATNTDTDYGYVARSSTQGFATMDAKPGPYDVVCGNTEASIEVDETGGQVAVDLAIEPQRVWLPIVHR